MTVHDINMNIICTCFSKDITSLPNLLKSADKIEGEILIKSLINSLYFKVKVCQKNLKILIE
jgi:hypothetical protein